MIEGKDELVSHLSSGRFLAGAARGRWCLIQLQWPYVYIQVRARDGRRFTLRFECSGYPGNAPTATLWDMASNQQLPAASWPTGGRVSLAFKPFWKGGAAIYIPCDRQSIAGHSNWYSEHPWLIWNPARGLLQYVEAVWEILNSHELDAKSA